MNAVVRKFLLQSNSIKRDSYVWNALSAMTNSFQTLLLLLVITRLGTDEDSSIFIMAFAIGNLMLCVGKYGVRQFQVTDTNEKYSFDSYKKARIVSVSIMLLISFVYSGWNYASGGYSSKKSIVVLLICLLKAIEASEDVFHGRMQQQGRLDIAGKILGVRLLIFILSFGILYAFSRALILTAVFSICLSLGISVYINRLVIGEFIAESRQNIVILPILKECLPLCLATVLNMYIANAPKYIIDKSVTDSVQTAYNIIFMPVFVMALLGNFIFQPQLKQMGELWIQCDIIGLISLIKRLFMGIILIDIVTAIGAYLIGCPILGLIYHYDLSNYRFDLVLFMIAGGVIALHNLFIMLIAAIRQQKQLLYGYFAISALLVFAGKTILNASGLLALNLFYVASLLLLLLIMIIIVIRTIQSEGR